MMTTRKAIIAVCIALAALFAAELAWLFARKKPAPLASCAAVSAKATPASVEAAPTNAPAPAAKSEAPAPPKAAAPVPAAPHVLTEAELAPLRAAFAPQRIAEDPAIPRGRQILLCRRRAIAPAERAIPAAASGAQLPSVRGTTPFLVQFSEPPGAKLRGLLVKNGAELRGYFPNNALLVELAPKALAAIGKIPEVRFATEFLPGDKLQPFLAELAAAQKEVGAPALVRVRIQFFSSQDLAAALPTIEKAGGNIRGLSKRDAAAQFIQAELPLGELEAMAKRGGVYWIEEERGVHP